jgi:hypothetical protein
MKRINYLIALLFLMLPLQAQQFQVASVNGEVHCLRSGTWEPLNLRATVAGTDTVRIGEHSVLSVIDRKAKKLYAVKSQRQATLANMLKGRNQSVAEKFVAHFTQALLRGDTEKISHEAHVSYKDISYDTQIYSALKTSTYTSAYPVSMHLIDAETGKEVGAKAAIGRKFFFRITNHSAEALFVNILDIASDGSLYDCFPIDEGGTMLHLIVPEESTVDFKDYPMEFTEPAGMDKLILIGCDQPFDLRNIMQFLNESKPAATPGKAGLYELRITIR